MPKIDLASLPAHTGTGYPPELAAITHGRSRKRLGDAGGLTQFGVNLCTIKPGAGSALRHWHHNEDEFVYVLAGEAVLIEDGGETAMRAGDAATFKAGVANGHHFVNRGNADVLLLEVGTRSAAEIAEYPDVDLRYSAKGDVKGFTRKDGTKY